jgi:hypothetical protein
MRDGRIEADGHRLTLWTWLDRPLSGWWCALGWIASTLLFVGIVQALGGPAPTDSQQSAGSTLAIAHGQMRCAFPDGPQLTAPLYPFLSGGVAAAIGLGHGAAFPSGTALGAHCDKAFSAIDEWTGHTHALLDLLRIGYMGWLFLLTGLVIFLRTVGRGRSRWEPATLLLAACLPPVWLTLESSFHPQDLIALGLALCAMAFALRKSWVIAGVFIALAVFSQQFAVLIAVPVLFLAPAERRWAFLGGAAGTAAIALLLLFLEASSRAVGSAFIGTGNTSTSDTLLMTLHLHGAPLVVLSRLAPVLVSIVLSWFVVRRFGPEFGPATLLSLVGLSLSLRLVFEQAIYGYYFMALVVLLLLLDVVVGHIRASFVAWLLMLTATYLAGPTTTFVQLYRVAWGPHAQYWITPIIGVIALVMIFFLLRRHAPSKDVLVWVALLAGAILVWPLARDPLSWHLSQMFWQVVLVPCGIALAGAPLLTQFQETRPEAKAMPEMAPGIP